MVIWIVLGTQGPIQAYTDKADAEAFAETLNSGKATSPFRVVSCALVEKTLAYLADPESWQGNPHDNTSVLFGHFTPYELAREALGLESSE
jgi:hypothetical protein